MKKAITVIGLVYLGGAVIWASNQYFRNLGQPTNIGRLLFRSFAWPYYVAAKMKWSS
jgi:hypothetical protein